MIYYVLPFFFFLYLTFILENHAHPQLRNEITVCLYGAWKRRAEEEQSKKTVEGRKIKSSWGGEEGRVIPQLVAATETAIVGQHGVQLRSQDGRYLSSGSDRELRSLLSEDEEENVNRMDV